MSRIEGPNVPPVTTGGVGDIQDAQALGQVRQLFKDILVVLENQNKNVQGPTQGQQPELPPPDENVDSQNLATLLLKLKMQTDEKQLKGAVEFIKARKEQIQQKYQEKIDKILEAAENAKKAEKTGKFMEVFGWVALGLSVAIAVAACVATGGLATGPVVAALLSVGMVVLEKTGAMGEIMEGLAKVFQETLEAMPFLKDALAGLFGLFGLDLDAEQLGMVLAAVTIMVLTILITKGSVRGAEAVLGKARTFFNVSRNVEKAATMTSGIAQTTTNVTAMGSAVAGATKGYYDSEALKARADAKEIQKFILKIQQQLEEEQDRVRELVEQMQANVSVVLDILKSEAKTREVIARQTAI